MVQDMGSSSEIRDMVDCCRFKQRGDLNNVNMTPMSLISLYSSLSKFKNTSLQALGLYPNMEYIPMKRINCIEEYLTRNQKGCGDVYKLLLNSHIEDNHFKTPPALQTARNDYNFPFKEEEWMSALRNKSKRCALPHSSTFVLKVHFRQNWTLYKQSMRSGNIEDAFCKYCTPNTKMPDLNNFVS